MDINRLQEFITLATLLNYSKAANQLYLTQPALSRHIHDLEQTIGSPLFIRDTHNVQLTPIGEIFLEEACEIIEKYNHAMNRIKEATSNASGELRLGFLGSASQYFLSDFLSIFFDKHPKIQLQMHSDNMDTLVKEVNDNLIDLAIVTHVDKNFYSGIESLNILTEPLYVIVNPKNPLASKQSAKMSDLSGVPYINFSSTSTPIAADFNKQLFKKANMEMNMVHEIPNIESALLYLNANAGIFIAPRYLIHVFNNSVAIPLEDDFCKCHLNLIWKKKNTNSSISIFTSEFLYFLQSTPMSELTKI